MLRYFKFGFSSQILDLDYLDYIFVKRFSCRKKIHTNLLRINFYFHLVIYTRKCIYDARNIEMYMGSHYKVRKIPPTDYYLKKYKTGVANSTVEFLLNFLEQKSGTF